MNETLRIGCESCGSYSGCECHKLVSCDWCGADFIPEDDELLCPECEKKERELEEGEANQE
jgi:Zn finger protein HypA/HybF involved in hydrogenase expression